MSKECKIHRISAIQTVRISSVEQVHRKPWCPIPKNLLISLKWKIERKSCQWITSMTAFAERHHRPNASRIVPMATSTWRIPLLPRTERMTLRSTTRPYFRRKSKRSKSSRVCLNKARERTKRRPSASLTSQQSLTLTRELSEAIPRPTLSEARCTLRCET